MTAQNGKDLLVKMDIDDAGDFQTVAGLRATRLSFNAESVDVTSVQSMGGWRELLAGAGVKTASLSGSGVFKDEATGKRVREVFFAGSIPAFEVIVPGLGTISGPFQIVSIEYAGNYNGEATYEISLASAGALAFTAVV